MMNKPGKAADDLILVLLTDQASNKMERDLTRALESLSSFDPESASTLEKLLYEKHTNPLREAWADQNPSHAEGELVLGG